MGNKIIKMKKRKSYDWKKTAKKSVIVGLEIVLVGGISYFAKQPLYLGIVPILEALRDITKHGLRL